MAYADRSTGGARIVAIVIVALLVAGLGYAFITGLAYKYVKQAQKDLESFDIVEPPPPPEEVPPPPPETPQQVSPPPVVSPPPLVHPPVQSPVQITTVTKPPEVFNPVPVVAPPAPPAPPPPPPRPVVNKQATAKGNPSNWITNDDYPSRSISAEEEGTSSIKWEINTSGRVENCVVVKSSGSSSLDKTACSLITRRGQYTPALDQNGNPIRSSGSRRVVWTLPK